MEDPILRHQAEQAAERLRNRISIRLKHIAKRVERELNDLQLPGEDRPVFALFVMMAGAAQYIGNGQREDIKTVVGSVLKRWDDAAHAEAHKPYHEQSEEYKEADRKDGV